MCYNFSVIELKNVKLEYYGEQTTLNVSFNEGVTMLLGEVGSFKTSVFFALGGVKEIIDGEIIVDGVNVEELLPKCRDMAFVGADSLPVYNDIVKALTQPLIMRKVSKKQACEIAISAATKFGLDITKKIKTLDKNELIDFFGARLSLRDTRITMFDEPYHFFEEENSEKTTAMIKSRSGYVLVSSCNGEDLTKLSPDNVIVLRRGNVLQSGKTDEVLGSPCNEYVKKFLIG